jgi:hypothetical protein
MYRKVACKAVTSGMLLIIANPPYRVVSQQCSLAPSTIA